MSKKIMPGGKTTKVGALATNTAAVKDNDTAIGSDPEEEEKNIVQETEEPKKQRCRSLVKRG